MFGVQTPSSVCEHLGLECKQPNCKFGQWTLTFGVQIVSSICERLRSVCEHSCLVCELSVCRPNTAFANQTLAFADRTHSLHSKPKCSQTELSVCRLNSAFTDRTQCLDSEHEGLQTEHKYRIFNYSDIPYISYNEMWWPSWRSSSSSLMSLRASVMSTVSTLTNCRVASGMEWICLRVPIWIWTHLVACLNDLPVFHPNRYHHRLTSPQLKMLKNVEEARQQ